MAPAVEKKNAGGCRSISCVSALAWLVCASASAAPAGEALQKRITVRIERESIRGVLNRLERSADASIGLSESATDALPFGTRTQVRLVVKEAPLERVLRDLGARLGLRHEVGGDGRIVMTPIAPLRRLHRRATLEELSLLSTLRTRTFDQVADSLRFADPDRGRRVVAAARGGGNGSKPAWEVLEETCGRLKLAWRPKGDRIELVGVLEAAQARLGRVVTLDHRDKRLSEVLRDVAKKADIPLHLSPNALRGVDARAREHFYIVARLPIRDALDKICEIAQLTWTYDGPGERIVVDGLAGPPNPGEELPRDDRLLGKYIPAPEPEGIRLEWLLRESEVSAEVRRLRDRTIRQALGQKASPSVRPPAERKRPIGKVIVPPRPDGPRFEFFIYLADLTPERARARDSVIDRAARMLIGATTSPASRPASRPAHAKP